MIHVVRLEKIPCEACQRVLKHIICFWFSDDKDRREAEEDYLEYIKNPQRGEEMVGERISPDSDIGKKFPDLIGKWVGYITHGKSIKTGWRYEACEMSKKTPRSQTILDTLVEAIKKERGTSIRRPVEDEPAEFRQAGHCPQRKKTGRPPGPSIAPPRKIV